MLNLNLCSRSSTFFPHSALVELINYSLAESRLLCIFASFPHSLAPSSVPLSICSSWTRFDSAKELANYSPENSKWLIEHFSPRGLVFAQSSRRKQQPAEMKAKGHSTEWRYKQDDFRSDIPVISCASFSLLVPESLLLQSLTQQDCHSIKKIETGSLCGKTISHSLSFFAGCGCDWGERSVRKIPQGEKKRRV